MNVHLISSALLLTAALFMFHVFRGPVARAAIRHVLANVEEIEKEFAERMKRQKQATKAEIRLIRARFRSTKAAALSEHVDKVFQK